MTPEERHILEHAVGWKHPRTPLYRNHFVSGPECDNWSTLLDLVSQGLMMGPITTGPYSGGMATFRVTDLGLKALEFQ